ncbi:MAG: 6-phosphofructokinase [Candidatus Saganbacteria bacterium]|nr:6-phosphofructokinase [Candidatus Saganbacteria bacterium]
MKIKRIGVLTTGGDAPGMNAAIRAVVRSAIFNGLEVVGIEKGFAGLIKGEICPLDVKSVGGIINRGGTILHTVRSPEFKQKSSRKKAFSNLKKNRIDVLVIIGGDGSLHGAKELEDDFGFPCVVVPATIDNDLPLTDFTIGYMTAVDTAVEAVDKIRDTASSHERVFIVQVMGREHGFLAVEVGLSCGAEVILVPEVKWSIDSVVKNILAGHKRGKSSSIIVMAEGAGDPNKVADEIRKETDLDVKVSILGYIQRGGTPNAFGRILACKFGEEAVDLILQGKMNRMVATNKNKITSFPIKEVLKAKKQIDMDSYKLAKVLAI